MMDVKVQYKDLSIQTSTLLTIPVFVIPKSSTAPATTITSLLSSLFPNLQQSTPIPTPTTTEATTSTTIVPDSETLYAIHQRLFDVENEVKTLRNVDHSLTIRAAVKFEVPIVVKEYLGTNVTDMLQQQLKPHKSVANIRKIKMEQAGKHQEPKYTIISSDSILEDENAMDKGVADKLEKRKPDDDRDKGPLAGLDQGHHQVSDLGEDTSNTDEPPVVNVDPNDWFKKLERPPTPDPEWNKGKSVENKHTQKWLSDLTKAEKPSKAFDDLMSTPIEFSAFVMNRLQISDLTQDILVGPVYELLKGTRMSYVELDYNMEECYKALTYQLDRNNPKCDRYPFDLSKPLPLVKSGNHQIVLVDYFFNNDLAYLQGEASAEHTRHL
ncbi:hypothetical protein Tco_0588955 [Tanacetum coccineum]